MPPCGGRWTRADWQGPPQRQRGVAYEHTDQQIHLAGPGLFGSDAYRRGQHTDGNLLGIPRRRRWRIREHEHGEEQRGLNKWGAEHLGRRHRVDPAEGRR
jgi:hypothetical protein